MTFGDVRAIERGCGPKPFLGQRLTTPWQPRRNKEVKTIRSTPSVSFMPVTRVMAEEDLNPKAKISVSLSSILFLESQNEENIKTIFHGEIVRWIFLPRLSIGLGTI